jgi:hypothetical protein
VSFTIEYKNLLRYISTVFILLLSQGAWSVDLSTSKNLNELFSGNSLQVTNKFGFSLIHFGSDGRFRHLTPEGNQGSDGVWRAVDDSICMTVTSLPLGRTPQEHCLEFKDKSFSKPWAKDDPRNGTVEYKLLVGHPGVDTLQKK